MKVQIKTDNKYHHDDGLVNGMIENLGLGETFTERHRLF